MPPFDRGEMRPSDERRTEKWTSEREAWKKIEEVLGEYNGNVWMIPPEKAPEFLQAAKLIVSTSESDPDFKPKPNILELAKSMVEILSKADITADEEIAA